jgi:hypothetical protein
MIYIDSLLVPRYQYESSYCNRYESVGQIVMSMTQQAGYHMIGAKGKAQNTS